MVEVIHSSDNLHIYNDDKHLKIYAGPGAGKTHLLIENIKKLIQHSAKLQSGFRKLLCITYTNVAADEIRNRLGTFNQYVVVSTIHSFLNEFVIKPNQLQLKEIIKENFGLIIDKEQKLSSVQEGFSTLSGHKKEEIHQYFELHYPEIKTEQYVDLSRTKMTEVQIGITSLNSANNSVNEKISLEYDTKKMDITLAFAIKEYVWNVAGRLSFDEILYFGYTVLEKYQLSTHLIRCEFPYILIDEYQDTNPIQNKIVKVLSEKECIVTVIGDVAQSIYSFQGADYREFHKFTLDSKLPIQNYVIKGNRRSTQNVIDFVNYLRYRDKELNEQTCEMNLSSNGKVTFLLQRDKNHFETPLESIIDRDTVVLCRKWSEVFKYISNVSEGQQKLLNEISNAYSFVLRRNFETEIESKREAWIKSMIMIVELEDAHQRRCIPSALKVLDEYLEINSLLHRFTEDSNQLLVKVMHLWDFANQCVRETSLLKDVVMKINAEMVASGLSIKSMLKYPLPGEEDYIESVYKHIDKLEYSSAKTITKEIYSPDSKYMTIHKAKGAEFSHVLINIEPAPRLDGKDCNPVDIICDPFIFDDGNGLAKYEEFTRIIYVAASRAKDKLYVHLQGDEETAQKIDAALDRYCKLKEKGKFYDFCFC